MASAFLGLVAAAVVFVARALGAGALVTGVLAGVLAGALAFFSTSTFALATGVVPFTAVDFFTSATGVLSVLTAGFSAGFATFGFAEPAFNSGFAAANFFAGDFDEVAFG